MGINKIIGYVLSLLGLAFFVASSKTMIAKIALSFPFMANIKPLYIMITAVILVIIGIVLIMSEGTTKTEADVPIYDKSGKKVVGYRRTR